jgi:hypothetical protein
LTVVTMIPVRMQGALKVGWHQHDLDDLDDTAVTTSACIAAVVEDAGRVATAIG